MQRNIIGLNLMKAMAPRAGLVQVKRTVTKNGTTFNQMFWIRPNEVKPTDRVLSGQQNLKGRPPGGQEPPDKHKQVHYVTSTKHAKEAADEFHKTFKNNKDFHDALKKHGIKWKEHEHEGINLMRSKMALKSAIMQGFKPPGSSQIPQLDKPQPAEDSKPDGKNEQSSSQSNDSQQTTQAQSSVQQNETPVTPIDPNVKQAAMSSKNKTDVFCAQMFGKDKKAFLNALDKMGVSWKPTAHEGINFMRAKMALTQKIEEGFDPHVAYHNLQQQTQNSEDNAQETTDNTSAQQTTQPQTDKQRSASNTTRNKPNTSSAKEKSDEFYKMFGKDKKAFLDALEKMGVSWKHNDHSGINFMRAKMALSKKISEGFDPQSEFAYASQGGTSKTSDDTAQPTPHPKEKVKEHPQNQNDTTQSKPQKTTDTKGKQVIPPKTKVDQSKPQKTEDDQGLNLPKDIKARYYLDNKEVTKEHIIEQFGKDFFTKKTNEAFEGFKDDPLEQHSWYTGKGMFTVDFEIDDSNSSSASDSQKSSPIGMTVSKFLETYKKNSGDIRIYDESIDDTVWEPKEFKNYQNAKITDVYEHNGYTYLQVKGKSTVETQPSKPESKPVAEKKKVDQKKPDNKKEKTSDKTKSISTRDYDSALSKSVGKKHYDDISNIVDKVKHPIAQLWRQHEKHMNVVEEPDEPIYCYNSEDKKIHFQNMDIAAGETMYHETWGILFHEGGHLIDYHYGKEETVDYMGETVNTTIPYSATWKGGAFIKAIHKDVDNLLKAHNVGSLEDYNAMTRDSVKSEIQDKYQAGDADWFVQQGLVQPDMKNDLAEEMRKTKSGYSYNKFINSLADTAFLMKVVKVQGNINNMKSEITKSGNPQEYQIISDLISGATKGDIELIPGSVHNKGYWQPIGGKEVKLAAEGFAEMTQATMSSPKALAMIKKVMPNTYSAYEEMLSSLTNNSPSTGGTGKPSKKESTTTTKEQPTESKSKDEKPATTKNESTSSKDTGSESKPISPEKQEVIDLLGGGDSETPWESLGMTKEDFDAWLDSDSPESSTKDETTETPPPETKRERLIDVPEKEETDEESGPWDDMGMSKKEWEAWLDDPDMGVDDDTKYTDKSDHSFPRDYDSKLCKAVGAAYYNELRNILSWSDSPTAKLWLHYEKDMNVVVTDDPKNPCHYDPDWERIRMTTLSSYGEPNQGVMLHEGAHYIDFKNGKYNFSRYAMDKHVPFSAMYKDGAFKKALREDVLDLLKSYGVDAKISSLNYGRVAFNSDNPDTKKKIDTMLSDLSKENVIDMGQVKDLITGVTVGGIFASGDVTSHTKEYWNQGDPHNESNLCTEAFAEFTAAEIENHGSIKKLKKYFPKGYKIFQEMSQELLNRKENPKPSKK